MRAPGLRDTIDRHLIALLQSDARQSTMTLARRLNLARSTVHERIRRLERDGVIRGYAVRLGRDPNEGYTQAVALLSIAQRQQRNVIAHLTALPEIKLCSTVSGECDLFVLLETPALDDLDAVLDEILRSPGVERCRSLVLLARKIDRLAPASGSETATALAQ